MSLMDLFSSKGGTFEPSPGSSRGNLKDWFHDMKGRRPFGRTIRPEDDSERGDWIDWFLNMRGLAGKFGGSERYKYDSYNPYDYQLFRNGGSVRSSPGPKTRQKLQPKEEDYIRSYDIGRNFNYPIEIDLSPFMGQNQRSLRGNFQSDRDGIMAMVDNRTSRDFNTWHQSPYFGIAGADFAKKRAPEYLDYFQDIKDRDAMARDVNFQVTLPENKKLGSLSGYKLLPRGVYPYFNPSLIENNPSFGLDWMTNIFGGTGKVGFRKDLDDDDYNAYAKWVKSW